MASASTPDGALVQDYALYCASTSAPEWIPPPALPPVSARTNGALGLGRLTGGILRQDEEAIFIFWDDAWCPLLLLSEQAAICGDTQAKWRKFVTEGGTLTKNVELNKLLVSQSIPESSREKMWWSDCTTLFPTRPATIRQNNPAKPGTMSFAACDVLTLGDVEGYDELDAARISGAAAIHLLAAGGSSDVSAADKINRSILAEVGKNSDKNLAKMSDVGSKKKREERWKAFLAVLKKEDAMDTFPDVRGDGPTKGGGVRFFGQAELASALTSSAEFGASKQRAAAKAASEKLAAQEALLKQNNAEAAKKLAKDEKEFQEKMDKAKKKEDELDLSAREEAREDARAAQQRFLAEKQTELADSTKLLADHMLKREQKELEHAKTANAPANTFESYQEALAKDGVQAWFDGYKPPKSTATTSKESCIEALSRGRGIPPTKGPPSLSWSRAMKWLSDSERAEHEKATRALRSFLAPNGSFIDEGVRSAAPLVKIDPDSFSAHHLDFAREQHSRAYCFFTENDLKEMLLKLLCAGVTGDMQLIGTPGAMLPPGANTRLLQTQVRTALNTRQTPTGDLLAGTYSCLSVVGVAACMVRCNRAQDVPWERFLAETDIEPLFSALASSILEDARWALLVRSLQLAGLVDEDGAKELETALSDSPLLGTLTPARICQTITPAVFWAVGRGCSLKNNRWAGSAKAGSWQNGKWLVENASIILSMTAGWQGISIDQYNENSLFPKSSTSKPGPGGPMAPPLVSLGSAGADKRRMGELPLLFDGNGKLEKHAPGCSGAPPAGGGIDVGKGFLYHVQEGTGRPIITHDYAVPGAQLATPRQTHAFLQANFHDEIRSRGYSTIPASVAQAHGDGSIQVAGGNQPGLDEWVVGVGGYERPPHFAHESHVSCADLTPLWLRRTQRGALILSPPPGYQVKIFFPNEVCNAFCSTARCEAKEPCSPDAHNCPHEIFRIVGFIKYRQLLGHAAEAFVRLKTAGATQVQKRNRGENATGKRGDHWWLKNEKGSAPSGEGAPPKRPKVEKPVGGPKGKGDRAPWKQDVVGRGGPKGGKNQKPGKGAKSSFPSFANNGGAAPPPLKSWPLQQHDAWTQQQKQWHEW